MIRHGMSHEQAGSEGGKARAVVERARLLERYAHLDRNEAIVRAWIDGRHAGKVARWRARTQERAS